LKDVLSLYVQFGRIATCCIKSNVCCNTENVKTDVFIGNHALQEAPSGSRATLASGILPIKGPFLNMPQRSFSRTLASDLKFRHRNSTE